MSVKRAQGSTASMRRTAAYWDSIGQHEAARKCRLLILRVDGCPHCGGSVPGECDGHCDDGRDARELAAWDEPTRAQTDEP